GWRRCTWPTTRCASSTPGRKRRPGCAWSSSGATAPASGAPWESARMSSRPVGWPWSTVSSTSCARTRRRVTNRSAFRKRTPRPLTTELPKQYDPQEAQERWLRFWDERGYFHSRPDPARRPFTIVIPPPNVTGALHMGHALNNTLQDVLIRWRRMQGYNAEWMPGNDHAGIATQAVVEKLIYAQEKKTRRDLGREELVRRIWAWKDTYEKRILGQLRELGCSCDWKRTRFTLDEGCSRAVRVTFFNW